MVFASPTFLFLFLPLHLVLYYLLPVRARTVWILVASWIFYGWWRLDFLVLLIASSITAAYLGRAIAAALNRGDERAARVRLTIGVTTALGALGDFKYFNFAVDTVSDLLAFFGGRGLELWSVVLPVGISFYIFQIVSYLVDVYRGHAPAGRSIVEIAAYVSLFPQLVAGPIVRAADFTGSDLS